MQEGVIMLKPDAENHHKSISWLKPDAKNHHKSVFWLKGLAILIIIMLVFTIISRITASFTVAKVSVEGISARKIQHTFSAEGQIQQNGEFPIVTESDILIKSLAVQEGESVEEGDLLLQLDPDHLSDTIDSVKNELSSLKLQTQALQQNKEKAASQRKTDISRAKQDYTDTIEKNEAAVSQAQQELKDARERLANAKQELTGASQDTREEKQAAYDDCKQEVSDKEAALEAAGATQQSEIKEAQRNIEDAQSSPETDNSIEINQLSMAQLEEKLTKLQELQKQEGKIYAPKSGMITRIDTAVGQKTSDTALLTMSDSSEGLKFTAQIEKESADYVSVGDTVTIQGSGKGTEDCQITSVTEDEAEDTLTVTANLKSGDFSMGESAQMTVKQESEEYPYTIPVTALVQENNKMYVLLLDTEDTVLGEQYVARKAEVDVLDKNTSYAALDSTSLDSDSQIIIDSDRYVEAGDRVRLMDE